jgi:hypothetical protein
VTILRHRERINDPDLQDRLYELLEHGPTRAARAHAGARRACQKDRKCPLADSEEAAKGDLAAAEIAQATHADNPAGE